MVHDGVEYLVIALPVLRVVRRIELAVARCNHDLVIFKDRMLLQQLRHGLDTIDAVKEPECMAQLVSQLRRAERKFFVRRQRIKEFFHVFFVDEAPTLYAEKFVEVERIFGVLVFGKVEAFLQRIADHVRELVGEHVETRQLFVGIRSLLRRPVRFRLLLVLVRPVENLLGAELAARDSLERRAGEVQREFAPDAVERLVRLVRIDALVRLVDDEEVPIGLGDPFQLRIVAAEINRALQPLQTLERDEPGAIDLVIGELVDVVLVCRIGKHGLVGERVGLADEQVAGLPADELREILIPRVRDARTVRHDEHARRVDAPREIIRRQRLAKARLRVPEERTRVVGVVVLVRCVIGRRLLHGALLLGAQHIRGVRRAVLHVARVAVAEVVKIVLRRLAVDMKPLRLRPTLDVLHDRQIIMELVIREIRARPVRITRLGRPLQMRGDVRRMRLLVDAILHALLRRVADLRPAVVRGDARSRIGVDHRNDVGERLDFRVVHFKPSPLRSSQ